MNQKILSNGNLLNDNGELIEAGYSFERAKVYNREKIKKLSRIKRKEWDYYAFLNDEHGICITVSNLTYAAMVSVTYLDFKANKYLTKTYTSLFCGDKKYKIPSNDNSLIDIGNNNFSVRIKTENEKITIYLKMINFANNENLFLNLQATKLNPNSIVTAIPFPKKTDFYYNQKINLIKAEGNIQIGNKILSLGELIGGLDWGRGVWPYKTTWYWSSMNKKIDDNNYIGFNLGYGLGDTSQGTENVVFYNDEIFKLDDVEFIFYKDEKGKIDFSKDVEIVSKNGDIDLIFTPAFDRKDHINFLIIESDQNQMFGHFSGKIKVKDREFAIDNYLGFLEKVINRY